MPGEHKQTEHSGAIFSNSNTIIFLIIPMHFKIHALQVSLVMFCKNFNLKVFNERSLKGQSLIMWQSNLCLCQYTEFNAHAYGEDM